MSLLLTDRTIVKFQRRLRIKLKLKRQDPKRAFSTQPRTLLSGKMKLSGKDIINLLSIHK